MAKKPDKSKRSRTANSPVAGRSRATSDQAGIRGNSGRFAKGKSGNPGGRPKELNEVKDLARAHTAKAIERLAFWMLSEDPKASVAAANALLDRAWGKATQPVSGEDGKPIDLNLGEVRTVLAGKLCRIAARGAA